ncbi:MAG: DEAD/DEAH box helicase [Syntrophomonadaceae bacterium]|nr:DEAD/DEAH box helicase [Syntrophomonadaceae bacterium]
MMSGFNDLGINAPILQALQEMGFESPTAVQCEAIPHILNQEDLIVISKTGSGKTAVFGVSMLQLINPDDLGPQGLILTPTRELAVQVDSDLKRIGKHLRHRTTAVYGQHNMNTEIEALKKGAAIVTGTPGRVYDHIQHGTLKTKHIRFLVLDEADRMLDMGFIDQVRRIIRTLPKNRVTLLFSATIPPEVQKLCQDYMKNPSLIEIESDTMTVDTTEQVYYRVHENEKRTQLNRLLQFERPESCIIFCNMRSTVDRVHSFLTQKGYASRALHGDIPQVKRLKTLQQFKQGDFHLLVATDVAARGIHIDELSLVINYDIPLEKDGYVHRIGRTGRAGNVGRALSLVTSDDIMSLYEIEEHIGTLIEEAELPTDEELKQHKDLVEAWKKANEYKPQPQRTAVNKNTGEQKRRPAQNAKSKPDRPREINAVRHDRQVRPQDNSATRRDKQVKSQDNSTARRDQQIRSQDKRTVIYDFPENKQTRQRSANDNIKPNKSERNATAAASPVRSAERSSRVQPAKTVADQIQTPIKPETLSDQPLAKKKPLLERLKERLGIKKNR